MEVSKKEWEAMEKRIADLERQVQGQQTKKDAKGAVDKTKRLLGLDGLEKGKVEQLIHGRLNCYLIDGHVFDLLEKRISKCVQSVTQEEGFNAKNSETLEELMKLYQFTDKGKIEEMSKRKIDYLIVRSGESLFK
jgi:hypothetical protein